MLTNWIFDLRFVARRLRARPGLAFSVVLTFALGIGSACLYFAVVNAVLLRPPPYPDAGRLVYIWETDAHNASSRESVSWPDLRDWRSQATSFADLGAYSRGSLTLSQTGGESERITAYAADPELFGVLGLHAQYGRLLTTADNSPQAAPVVVLGQELWQRLHGGDPQALGKTLQLDGVEYEIVGALPRSPGTVLHPQLWIPLAGTPAFRQFSEERGVHTLTVIGRLRADASTNQAQQQMDAIAARLDTQYPKDNVGRGARVEGMHDYQVRDLREPLLLLGIMFALLLLIATVNVAGLLLAHATTRRQELAVRASLGADRRRLLRQLGTEGLVLGSLGSAAGVLIAWLAAGILAGTVPSDIVDLSTLRADARTLAFGFGLWLLTSTLAAILPLLSLARVSAIESLRSAGMQKSAGGGGTRRGLVGGQAAIATVLALTSVLLLRSLWELNQLRPGLNAENVLSVSMTLPDNLYPMPAENIYPRWPALTQFYDRLLDGVRAVPEIRQAALTYARPLRRSWTVQVQRPDIPAIPGAHDEWQMRPFSPGYLSTLQIPLLAGRDVAAQDSSTSPQVVLINAAAAQRYFPGEDPLGKQIVFWGRPHEVVGVVADVRSVDPNEAATPAIHPPLAQTPFTDVTIVAKTHSDPLGVLAALRTAVANAQPNLALYNIMTLEQDIDGALSGRRLGSGLVIGFALLALLLVAVGLYGVVALEVSQRNAEIGLRLALGARARDVALLICKRSLAMAAAGAAVGCVLVVLAGRLLHGVLFGVHATDPVAMACGLLTLTLVAVAACVIPARRALRVDPMVALRSE